MDMIDVKSIIGKASSKKILFTLHALDQMNKPERLISEEEVRFVISQGIIIENYPEDERGHSCLMAAETPEHRVVHVVCAPKNDYLAVITAYIPEFSGWDVTLKIRRR